MKITRTFPASTLFVLSVALAGFVAAACAADRKPAAAPTSPTTNTLALLDPQIPESVFNPAGARVKDPFFPHSLRTQVVVTNNIAPAVISASSFILRGLSISSATGESLAIINNRSLAVGERVEITLADARKIGITLLKIKENSVLIRPDGQNDSIEVVLPSSVPKPTKRDNN